MLVHNGKKDFQCHVCGKHFTRKSSLNTHLITHTFTANKFKCDICGKSFTQKGCVKTHMLVHT